MNNKKNYLVTILAIALIAIGVLLLMFAIVKGKALNNWYPIFIGLGVSFVPSGLITVFFKLVLSKEVNIEIESSITKNIKNEFKDFKKIHNLKEQGIENITNEFPKNRLEDLISASSNKLDILNTWIPNIRDIKSAIIKAMDQNCKIRFLVLSPDSLLIKYRAKQLGVTVEYITENINYTIDFFKKIKKDNPNIELRFYDDLFSLSIYKFDEIIFTGWYWAHLDNLNGPYLKIIKSPTCHFASAIELHFDKIWKNAKSI